MHLARLEGVAPQVRWEALMIRSNIYDSPAGNGEPLGENETIRQPIEPGGTPKLGRRYTVPARQGRAVRVARGQSITVTNTHGSQVCDFWAFSAANPGEFLSWEHARGWINRLVPSPTAAGRS